MVNKDDSTPATKADLDALRKATQVDFENLRSELLRQIRAEADETRRHFDVVAERMLHEFRGAFGDRTSQHDDKIENHEHRLGVVERQLGLVV